MSCIHMISLYCLNGKFRTSHIFHNKSYFVQLLYLEKEVVLSRSARHRMPTSFSRAAPDLKHACDIAKMKISFTTKWYNCKLFDLKHNYLCLSLRSRQPRSVYMGDLGRILPSMGTRSACSRENKEPTRIARSIGLAAGM